MKRKTKLFISSITFIVSILLILSSFYLNASPEIKLNGANDITINLNEEYKEKGVKATLFKKDISNKVKIKGTVDNKKIGTYKIEYIISNNFIKNSTSVSRFVTVVDNTSSEIKLKGKDSIFIYIGDKYIEPGFTANDNYDGDITKQVVTTNNINNKKIGTYEVSYTVMDTSDNKAEVKRKVIVKEKPIAKTSTQTVSNSSSKKIGYGIPVLMYH